MKQSTCDSEVSLFSNLAYINANLLFQIKLISDITSVTKGETKTYYKQLHEDQPSSLRR